MDAVHITLLCSSSNRTIRTVHNIAYALPCTALQRSVLAVNADDDDLSTRLRLRHLLALSSSRVDATPVREGCDFSIDGYHIQSTQLAARRQSTVAEKRDGNLQLTNEE